MEPNLVSDLDKKSLIESIVKFLKKCGRPVSYVELKKREVLASTSIEKQRLSKADWVDAWAQLSHNNSVSLVRGSTGTLKAVYIYVPEDAYIMTKRELSALSEEIVLRLCMAVHSLTNGAQTRGLFKDDAWREVYKEPFIMPDGTKKKFYMLERSARSSLNKVVIEKAKLHPEWPIAVEKDNYVPMKSAGVPTPKSPAKATVKETPAVPAEKPLIITKPTPEPKKLVPQISVSLRLNINTGTSMPSLFLNDTEVVIRYDESSKQFILEIEDGEVSGQLERGASFDRLPMSLLEVRVPVREEA